MIQVIHECNADVRRGHEIVSLDDCQTWLMRWYEIVDHGIHPCYIAIRFCPFCGERLS